MTDRFIIEHGVVHDIKTGRHLTQAIEDDYPQQLCDLLNEQERTIDGYREALLVLVELKRFKRQIEAGTANADMKRYYEANKEGAWLAAEAMLVGCVRTEVERTPRHPSDKWKLWANADPEQMEPYYSYWVGALTSEGLHAKADIATVLALLHQQRDDLDDDARRLHREKMDALFGSDGMPANSPLIEALDWALRRIRTSLDQGEMYAKAEAALEKAKLTKPVSPLATYSPEKP